MLAYCAGSPGFHLSPQKHHLVVRAWNLSTWEVEAVDQKFRVIIGYRVSLRLAWLLCFFKWGKVEKEQDRKNVDVSGLSLL